VAVCVAKDAKQKMIEAEETSPEKMERLVTTRDEEPLH
jgi:hypothetical protein